MAQSNDGRWFAYHELDPPHPMRIVELAIGATTPVPPSFVAVRVGLSQDGTVLAGADATGDVWTWVRGSATAPRKLGHVDPDAATGTVVALDADHVVVLDLPGHFRLVTPYGATQPCGPDAIYKVRRAAISVIVTATDGELATCDFTTGRGVTFGDIRGVQDIAMSDDGTRILVLYQGGSV